MRSSSERTGLPNHILNFEENIADVASLVNIQPQLRRTGARRRDMQTLNKSALVLLVACWEAYVEDLATESFDSMLKLATDPKVFPGSVLSLASKKLRKAHDGTKVWQLAGRGWRAVLKKHRDAVLAQHVGSFNTPFSTEVARLFRELVGERRLVASWRWRGMSSQSAVRYLDQLVTERCQIAHRVAAEPPLRKGDVTKATDFMYRLAGVSSNRMRVFVNSRADPDVPDVWPPVRLAD